MNEWPYDIGHLAREDIMRVIQCPRWQEFRLSLKGIPTTEKLVKLQEWYQFHRDAGNLDTTVVACTRADAMMQVDNYLNALLRGGQLVRVGDKVIVNR